MPGTKKTKTESEFLWFDERTTVEKISEELEKNAKTVKRLHIQSASFLGCGALEAFDLPNLTELLISNIYYLDTPAGWSFLHRLESLESLVSGMTTASDSMIDGLAEAPWWSQLTNLDLCFLKLDETKTWSKLWSDRKMAVELLCLRYLTTQQACDVLLAELKSLKYLILGITKGAPFLDRLALADLPHLEDLELRHAGITQEKVLEFIEGTYPNLPKLTRIGKTFYSDEKYDVCDWNGAVVDWSYREFLESETQEKFFKDTKYSILPSNSELEGRSPSGWIRPLKRMPD